MAQIYLMIHHGKLFELRQLKRSFSLRSHIRSYVCVSDLLQRVSRHQTFLLTAAQLQKAISVFTLPHTNLREIRRQQFGSLLTPYCINSSSMTSDVFILSFIPMGSRRSIDIIDDKYQKLRWVDEAQKIPACNDVWRCGMSQCNTMIIKHTPLDLQTINEVTCASLTLM